MTQKLIPMTQKELSRYSVIKNSVEERIKGTDASKQIQVSVRQIRRIKVRVKKKGIEGIIHGKRG